MFTTKQTKKKMWLRHKDIGEKIGIQNICDLVDEEIKGKCETDNPTKDMVQN